MAGFLGAGALAVALPLVAASGAYACSWTGGHHGGMPNNGNQPTGYSHSHGCKVTEVASDIKDASVTLALAQGSSCVVTLASYYVDAPQWNNSGKQIFIDSKTITLTKGAQQSLTVKAPVKGNIDCYGQVDLYYGDVIYDGQLGVGHGPVPDEEAGVVTPPSNELIDHWNGGSQDCSSSTAPVPGSTVTPSVPAQTPTPAGSATATVTAVAPAGNGSPTPTGSLAHTGGGDTPLIIGGALVLLVLGGAGAFGSRRLAARRSH